MQLARFDDALGTFTQADRFDTPLCPDRPQRRGGDLSDAIARDHAGIGTHRDRTGRRPASGSAASKRRRLPWRKGWSSGPARMPSIRCFRPKTRARSISRRCSASFSRKSRPACRSADHRFPRVGSASAGRVRGLQWLASACSTQSQMAWATARWIC
jgi:hypothetical protein